jgi:hypothetical protein
MLCKRATLEVLSCIGCCRGLEHVASTRSSRLVCIEMRIPGIRRGMKPRGAVAMHCRWDVLYILVMTLRDAAVAAAFECEGF